MEDETFNNKAHTEYSSLSRFVVVIAFSTGREEM